MSRPDPGVTVVERVGGQPNAQEPSRLELRALELALAGDRGAREFLFARHADDVYELCCSLLDEQQQSLAARLTRRVFAFGEEELRLSTARLSPRAMLMERATRLIATV